MAGESSLLQAPSEQKLDVAARIESDYQSYSTYALPKDKHYQQQFGNMYFVRLTKLKPAVEQVADAAWAGFQIAGETVRRVDRVLDVRQGELCWVAGTVYMEMKLKPNILDDLAKDLVLSAPHGLEKYRSAADGDDCIMLEDESGRLRLTGMPLANELLVTGCIIAVMGTENANGDFEVVDIRVPDLPMQPQRWAEKEVEDDDDDDDDDDDEMKTEEPATTAQVADTDMSEAAPAGRNKIAFVSGLGISGSHATNALQLSLLTEFLLGEALSGEAQAQAARISRLVIAGNALRADEPCAAAAAASTAAAASRKKKYGYDSSAYNAAPTARLDDFLADLLPSLPITFLPGAADPANVALPQQPLHPAMLPRARAYAAERAPPDAAARAPGWFDAVTNPWEGRLEGWRVVGTGGQNVDDVFKYVEGDDRVAMLEAMCRWRVSVPTAPDTLWSYPFHDDDPFVMSTCPHVFFAGGQPRFGTALIGGPDGQTVRVLAVPSFDRTGEIVLLDAETLQVEVVQIGVFEHPADGEEAAAVKEEEPQGDE